MVWLEMPYIDETVAPTTTMQDDNSVRLHNPVGH